MPRGRSNWQEWRSQDHVRRYLICCSQMTTFFFVRQKGRMSYHSEDLEGIWGGNWSNIFYKKSSIQFGVKIEESARQELRDILGIQNIRGMRLYLGIPYRLGGSKIQIFSFVQDRLYNMVNGWTFKFLFYKGKQVSNHQISGYCYAKSCYVLLSVT